MQKFSKFKTFILITGSNNPETNAQSTNSEFHKSDQIEFDVWVYNQERLILQTIYVVNKKILCLKPAGYNGACTVYVYT